MRKRVARAVNDLRLMRRRQALLAFMPPDPGPGAGSRIHIDAIRPGTVCTPRRGEASPLNGGMAG